MWLDIPPIIIVISLLSFAKQRLICIRALSPIVALFSSPLAYSLSSDVICLVQSVYVCTERTLNQNFPRNEQFALSSLALSPT
jgi:hypothetical protein